MRHFVSEFREIFGKKKGWCENCKEFVDDPQGDCQIIINEALRQKEEMEKNNEY